MRIAMMRTSRDIIKNEISGTKKIGPSSFMLREKLCVFEGEGARKFSIR
jgi:hypothetical protein